MPVIDVEAVPVPVSDPDRSKAFYTRVLGFEVVKDDHGREEGTRPVLIAPKGSRVRLSLVTSLPSMPPGSVKGLVLRVDDIEVAVLRLTGHGVPTVNGIESAPWGRFVRIEDPDGNGLVLQQKA